MEPKIRRSAVRLKGMKDPELDFQLLRSLSVISSGGAALGECLEVAGKITSLHSWVKEWGKLGDRLASIGAFARASMAYRNAEFFAKEPRKYGLKSRKTFRQAFDPRMPSASSYFFPGKGPGDLKPTLLVLGGFDSSLEELYFQAGYDAIERGFNVLLFEGPGQTDTRRDDPNSTFDPAYEKVLIPAVDSAIAQRETDPESLFLMGISFGGHFALRAAAYERRLRALVLNSPIVNLGDYLGAFFPENMPDSSRSQIEAATPDECPPIQQHLLLMLFDRFGVNSLHALFHRLEDFAVSKRELAQITCPTLALVAEGEGSEPLHQLELFEEGATAPVTRHILTQESGANSHCGLSNLPYTNRVSLDFLARSAT